jgi:hypothetical protein
VSQQDVLEQLKLKARRLMQHRFSQASRQNLEVMQAESIALGRRLRGELRASPMPRTIKKAKYRELPMLVDERLRFAREAARRIFEEELQWGFVQVEASSEARLKEFLVTFIVLVMRALVTAGIKYASADFWRHLFCIPVFRSGFPPPAGEGGACPASSSSSLERPGRCLCKRTCSKQHGQCASPKERIGT